MRFEALINLISESTVTADFVELVTLRNCAPSMWSSSRSAAPLKVILPLPTVTIISSPFETVE